MEADIAEVEEHLRLFQDERSTDGITKVQSGPDRIKAGHWDRGHGRNWVMPWMEMSNSSTCRHHCDGFELDAVREF